MLRYKDRIRLTPNERAAFAEELGEVGAREPHVGDELVGGGGGGGVDAAVGDRYADMTPLNR